MALRICELVSIILLALVGGLYWGPWLALTRSIATLEPAVFLVVVDRLSRNMAPIMTVLMPVSLLSTIPVMLLAYEARPETFYLTLVGLALFVVTLLVTVLIEVPIVKKIEGWTIATMPDNWQELRDRWGRFHIFRVVPAIAGLICVVLGAIS